MIRQSKVYVDRQRCLSGKVFDRGGQALLSERSRKGAVCKRPKRLQGLPQASIGRGQRLNLGGVRAGEGEPKMHRDRHQPLLRSVVQVALKAATLGVGRCHDAPLRRLYFGEPRAVERVELAVLERDPVRRVIAATTSSRSRPRASTRRTAVSIRCR